MRTQSTDTNPLVEEKLINILKESSIPKRLSILYSLSSFAIKLSKRALAKKNPKMSKQELDLLFIKINYGEKFYKVVNQFLQKASNGEE